MTESWQNWFFSPFHQFKFSLNSVRLDWKKLLSTFISPFFIIPYSVNFHAVFCSGSVNLARPLQCIARKLHSTSNSLDCRKLTELNWVSDLTRKMTASLTQPHLYLPPLDPSMTASAHHPCRLLEGERYAHLYTLPICSLFKHSGVWYKQHSVRWLDLTTFLKHQAKTF